VRIVSLVPSLTELLFALDLGEQVVGRTGFCIHPRERVRRVPKVGGNKSVDVERIRALEPTHVVVNIDENEKPTVDAIARFVPHVVVTHPLTVDDNLALYRQFGEAFGRHHEAARLQASLASALDDARRQVAARGWSPRPVAYLIWKDPWMTVAADTYIASMLALVGLQAIAPDSDRRYPEVDWATFPPQQCEAILFSSEPYRFRDRHLREFATAHGLAPGRCRLIDGEMASWYGPRAIEAVPYMVRFRESLGVVLDGTG
jgi:ABC-type Fe3+-hydroxamate transport system substrate-binding protein